MSSDSSLIDPPPDLSIVTAVYNDARLARAIESIRDQDYSGRIEHIVVDGGSTDETVDVIRRYRGDIDVLIQEPDAGIYDAMNKGLRIARGSTVAILNADDRYASPAAVRTMLQAMSTGAEAAYGDITIEDDDGTVVRTWRAGPPGRWRWGWMPPHPSLFVRRDMYERHGMFRTDLSVAADYEFMVRVFMRNRIPLQYVPAHIVRMASGGASQGTLKALMRNWRESARAWSVNRSTWGPIAATAKPLRKARQFWARRP